MHPNYEARLYGQECARAWLDRNLLHEDAPAEVAVEVRREALDEGYGEEWALNAAEAAREHVRSEL